MFGILAANGDLDNPITSGGEPSTDSPIEDFDFAEKLQELKKAIGGGRSPWPLMYPVIYINTCFRTRGG